MRFTIIGYDKDSDVYEEYGEFTDINIAKEEATRLAKLVRQDELVRIDSYDNNEPIDWVEIYRDYDTPDETLIWSDYNDYER